MVNRILIVLTLLLSGQLSLFADSAKWPYVFPCRTEDGNNKDLMVMTLGEVDTPLANAVFDPATDIVSLDNGTKIENYYREVLNIKNYSPIDKTIFPVPPSGWCTWYFYYSRITEDEVKRNAKWIAENLKDYGAEYVQIDDGWQGADNDPEKKRDWNRLREGQFPNGMKSLADYIKSLGLTPGIWIAPHGQTDTEFALANKDVFIFKPDGQSASETWEGKFLMDPTTEASEKYFRDLFQKLCDWGYEYFKIDGQPIVVDEYRTKNQYMKTTGGDNVELYRDTLDIIRDVIGPEKYLLGCWGMPVEGIGIMNGSRTAGDVVLGWDGGFMLALRATQRDYYLHNIAWYNDPDVFILRSPMTYPQAQAWATLQGLSGVALMGTDRLEDLSDDRVDLMRRIYPAVDIRPMDLFQVKDNKRIMDLKVNHLGRRYDVAGVFNYDQDRRDTVHVKWEDLGLDSGKSVHVFDFWNKDYLGCWEGGIVADVDPTSCRVLTLMPDSGNIELVSTSRHITQGWVDLVKLEQSENAMSGSSHIIKGDPYQLTFAFPKGKNFIVKSAVARSDGNRLRSRVTNHQGWATVTFRSRQTCDIDWKVEFEPAEFYPYPVEKPDGLKVVKTGDDTVEVVWREQYWLNNGYQLYLDSKLMGYTPKAMFPLAGLDKEAKHTVEVETTWEDGTVSEKKTKIEFTMDTVYPESDK